MTRPTSGRLVVGVLALGGLAASLTQTLIVPLLPSFPRLLGVSVADASWLITITVLTAAFATSTMGRLGDMYGRRRVLLIALGFLIVGSVVCALADTLWLLLVGRALQGLSVAAIPLGISLLGTVVEQRRVPLGIALVSATMGAGAAVGLPLSGWIADRFDYHLVFWLSALIAALVAAAVLAVVPSVHVGAAGRLDLVGGLLFVGALAALLLPLSSGNVWGWTDPSTLGLFALCVVLTAILVPYEWRRPDPLVQIRTLIRHPVLLTNVASILAGYALFANFIAVPAFVQMPEATGYGFGTSVMTAGLVMLPSGLAMVVVAPVAGQFIGVYGARTILLAGMSVVIVGYVLRLVLQAELWQVVLAATVIGIGAAAAFSAMPALVLSVTPPADAGAATGINALARSIGTAVASASLASVMTAFTVTIGGEVFPSAGAVHAVGVLGGLAAVAAAGCIIAVGGRRARVIVPGDVVVQTR